MSDLSPQREHQDKWLNSLTADELRKWIRKNSCLCDMAGICNGCALADARYKNKRLASEVDRTEDMVKWLRRNFSGVGDQWDTRWNRLTPAKIAER